MNRFCLFSKDSYTLPNFSAEIIYPSTTVNFIPSFETYVPWDFQKDKEKRMNSVPKLLLGVRNWPLVLWKNKSDDCHLIHPLS